MSKYLLTCACGKEVPVEIGQAGGRVACSCGAQLDVPTLRQLRHLPQEKSAEPRPASRWSTRHGAVAASLIIVAALLGWSAWSWWNDPVAPKFDTAVHLRQVEEQIKTPAGAWEAWIGYYRPLAERGMPVFQMDDRGTTAQKLSERRFLRGIAWSVAGVFAAVAAAGIFWPKPKAIRKTGRGGEGEKGR